MIVAIGFFGAILVVGGLALAFRMRKRVGFFFVWAGLIPLGVSLSLAYPAEHSYGSIPDGAVVVATFGFLIVSFLQAMWGNESRSS